MHIGNSGIEHLWIGGLAASCFVKRRSIADLDLVCRLQDIDSVRFLLKEIGFKEGHLRGEPRNTHFAFVRYIDSDIQKLHLVIDELKILDDSYKRIEIRYPLRHLIKEPFICNLGSMQLHIPPIEHLVVMKMIFARGATRAENKKHLSDLSKLLTSNIPSVDRLERLIRSMPKVHKRILRRRSYILDHIKNPPTWFVSLLSDLESDTWDEVANQYCAYRSENSLSRLMELPAVINLIDSYRGVRALDAGCGGGFYADRLLHMGFEVTGFDISSNMLAYAKKVIGKRSGNLLRLDSSSLGFKDESFDMITAGFLLDNVGDYKSTIREFFRVLKHGGILVMSLPHPLKTNFEDMLFPSKSKAELPSIWKDYFLERKYVESWKLNGKHVRVSVYHRPLKSYVNTLLKFGFTMEGFDEPEPLDKSIPPRIARARRVMPTFLVIRAKKN